MHGLGNDFVVLDGVRHPVQLTVPLIQQMADRHRGIGFDQLLLIEPAQHTAADFVYRIFNADGSEVGQCGNGARCVGRFLRETGLIPATQSRILLHTADRGQTRILEVHADTDGQMTVNMGVPVFDPPAIPLAVPPDILQLSQGVPGFDFQTMTIFATSLGNPHAVLQVADIQTAPVSTLGATLAQHPYFPDSVNVGFMQIVQRDKILLRVYERGAAETLACGSGAVAAMVIGCMQGWLDAAVDVHLPGGHLHISWQGRGQPAWMKGPAEIVFTGEWLAISS